MIPAILIIIGAACIAWLAWEIKHAPLIDSAPRCPHCDREARYIFHEADVREEYGERFHDTWWTCSLCGERVDEAELSGGVL